MHLSKLLNKIVKIVGINLALFIFTFSLIAIPSTVAKQPQYTQSSQNQPTAIATPQQLLEQGESFFQAGRFSDAVTVLQQAIRIYQQSGNNLGQAAAQTNLSLAFEQLGSWKQATESINTSLNVLGWDNANYTLKVNNPKLELLKILAATLDIQSGLQLRQGHPDAANETAKRAEIFWHKLGDNTEVTRSRINQAQALRVSGFNSRASKILESVSTELQLQPGSVVKLTALRSLGNVQQQLGKLEESKVNLQQSLKIAQHLQLPQEISLTELSLGNTTRLLGNINDAIAHYENAAALASNPLIRAQAQINQLSLLIKSKPIAETQTLISTIQSQIPSLPTNHAGIYARINFARTVMNLTLDKKGIAEILATSVQQAKAINDLRSESYALGSLAEVYEQDKQWQVASDLTRKAWSLSQKINANDIAYRWEWQLGRLLKAQGNIPDAIAAYDASVETLESLRTDLAGVNREVQFNFRDSIEPIYRQSVELLLLQNGEAKPDLDKVRKRMEALQLSELDNYFREACLNNQFVVLDKVLDRDNLDTAIFYPIILDNHLEIILKLPRQPLVRKTSIVNSQQIENIIKQIEKNIVEPDEMQKFTVASKQLYEWLIKPVEAELQNSRVKTLVFIPDGSLRNIPMAALYDDSSKKYLVQKYALAISPGLQLFTPKPLARQKLNALVGGLSQPPKNEKFAPLPNVKLELESIQKSGVSTTTLYN